MTLLLLAAIAAVIEPVPPPLAATKGAFFALSVPDADAAVRWYSGKLGLKVIMRPPVRSGREVVILGGGGLIVELIQQPGAVPLREAAPQVKHDTMVHGLFKAGVVVDDWEGLIAGLKARGIPTEMGPFPRSSEQRANLIIRDLDGNYIQFIESVPAPSEGAGK